MSNTRKKRDAILSLFLAVLMVVTSFANFIQPATVKAQGETETITIIDPMSTAFPDSNAWAGRQGWLSKTVMQQKVTRGLLPGVTVAQEGAPMYTFASSLQKDVQTVQGTGEKRISLNFVKELFKDSEGRWVQCYDIKVPATPVTRPILDKLPAGYDFVSEAELTEIASAVGALFPNGKDPSVLGANVESFVKPKYHAQAKAMFAHSTDGSYGAAVLMQALVWIRVHEIDPCRNKANSYYIPPGSYYDPKTGQTVYTNATTIHGNYTHICDVIDFDALYKLGVRLSKEQAKCFDIELDYKKKTEFSGEVAETIRVIKSENKLPPKIDYEYDEATKKVYLTSNHTVAQDFGEIRAGGIKNKFSALPTYTRGQKNSGGQLIVQSYKVKNVCLRVKVKDGFGVLGVKSKVEAETGKAIPGVKFGVYTDAKATKKVAELVTNAKGQAVSKLSDELVIGTPYYIRELTKAEGQIKGILPNDDLIAKVVMTAENAKETNPKWAEFDTNVGDNPTILKNDFETFRFKFTKSDSLKGLVGKTQPASNPKPTLYDGTQYKLKVLALDLDLKLPGFVVGSFVKENRMSNKDQVYTVKNGVIEETRRYLLPGRYELVEVFVPETVPAQLAPKGESIIFESVSGQEFPKVISNGTSAAYDRQIQLFKDLGSEYKVTNVGSTVNTNVWHETTKLGLIRIIKKHDTTGQGLEGFKFRVTAKGDYEEIYHGGKWVKSAVYTSGKNGIVLSDPMKLGNYEVEEIEAPAGFRINPDKAKQTVVVEEAQSTHNAKPVEYANGQQVFDLNLQKGFVTKRVGETSFAGAEFEVKVVSLLVPGVDGQKQAGEVVGKFNLDSEGKLSLKNMPLGTYEIKETKAPKGTVLNPNPIRITAKFQKNADGTTPSKSKDITVEYGNANNAFDDKMTQMKDKLTIVWNSYLKQDEIGNKTYTFEQVGLAKDTTKPKAGTALFKNMPIMGRVEINKHMDLDPEIEPSEKPAEEGITFKIYNKKGTLVDEFTTNYMGRGGSKYLPFGTYKMSQFNTVMKDGKPLVHKVKDFNFTIDKDGQVLHYTLENAPERMRLKIQKIDEQTGKNILQPGVKFKLYDAKTNKAIKFTQYYPEPKETELIEISAKNGFALTIDKLMGGEYYLREVAGPKGYFYDPDVKIPVTIPYELAAVKPGELPLVEITIGTKTETVVDSQVENTPQYGELVIHKQGEKLTKWTEKDVTLKVQDQGTVETKEIILPQARVSLVVKSVTVKEIEVDVTEVDSNEQKDDETGNADEEDDPDPGKTPEKKTEIRIQEVEAFKNVKTDDKGAYKEEVGPGTYTVYDSENNVLQELTVEEGKTGVISIQLPDKVKTEEVRIDGKVHDKKFTYNVPVFEKGYLPEAKFEIIAHKDLVSKDGQTVFFKKGDKLPIAQRVIKVGDKIVYKEGEVITLPKLSDKIMKDKKFVDYTITTKGDKPVKISKIPLGHVAIKEVEAPIGYKLDETLRDYVFTPQEHTILVDLKETEKIENFRQILTLQLNKKVVEETKYFGRGGYEYLVFGVYTAEENNGLAKDSLVGVVQPNKKGIMTINDVLNGKYYFKEISTKDAYQLNDKQYSIVAEYDHNATEDKVEIIKEDVVNKPKEHKEIVITKIDVRTGDVLTGVQFKLYAITSDGTKIPVKNGDDDIWMTNEEGKIIVGDLPEGNYVWEEVKTNPGYVEEESSSYNVAVSDDSNLEITVENTPTNAGFRKYDMQTGKPVIGAVLRLEVKTKDGEWVPVQVNEKGHVVENGTILEWVSDGTLKNVYGLHVDKDYRLVEVKMPDGYSTSKPVTFIVDNSKGIQLTSLGNQIIRAKIKKLDESSLEPVVGATLELYEDGSDEVFVDPVTNKPVVWETSEENADGFLVHGLVVGKTYIVKETVIPEGYNEPFVRYAMLIADRQEIQTYTFLNEPTPLIKTTAIFESGVKENSVDEKAKLIDKVNLERLVVGATYTAKARLVDQNDASKVLAEGETTFEATATEMDIEVEMVVNAKSLEGTTGVVFENLFRGEREVATHEEITDEDQTVYFPKVRTTATDFDSAKDMMAKEEATLLDKVIYSNLKVGQEYTVKGILMNKETNKPIEVDGKPVEASKTFTAEKSDGKIVLEFKFDASALKGQTIVVFEDLFNGEIKVAAHANINDEDQTVYIPEIKTTATDIDGHKDSLAKDDITIIDIVKYSNLLVGKEYTVKGHLMIKETNSPLLVNGEMVTAERTFVAEEANGEIELRFNLNASELQGQSIVVFENLFREEKHVAVHEEITDEDQTVRIPEVRTKAIDKETGLQNTEANKGEKVIVDTVMYKNLLVGKEYEVKGILVDKATGLPIAYSNEFVKASKKFIAEQADGEIELEFVISSDLLEGRALVAYESLYRDDRLVGVHAEIDDEDQTVYIPEIRTQAKNKEDGSNVLDGTKIQTVVDTVSYKNLQPGNEYKVSGHLVVKSTGEKVVDKDGNVVTAEKVFTPETADGFVELEFTFDASLYAGEKLVVFEEVTQNDIVVGTHANIEDEAQTVSVTLLLDVRIAKADKANIKHFLKGAEITIFNQDGTIAKDVDGNDCVGLTDENGEVRFVLLYDENNTYYAQETKAPAGYHINNDKFEIRRTGKDKLGTDLIKIDVLDQAIIIPPAPPTGVDQNMLVYILLAVGALLIAAGAFVVIRRRKQK